MTKPWKRSNPESGAKITLTPANLAWARARAKKAGRRYPNLIDNMAAARRQQEAAGTQTDWRKGAQSFPGPGAAWTLVIY